MNEISTQNTNDNITAKENCLAVQTNESIETEMERTGEESVATQHTESDDKRCKRALEFGSESEDKTSVSPTKKLKSDSSMSAVTIYDFLQNELKRVEESFLEHVLELIFLESGANVMEFHAWRKKVNNNAMFQYLRLHGVDSDKEIKELLDLKMCIDSSMTSAQSLQAVSSTPMSSLSSTATSSAVLEPTPQFSSLSSQMTSNSTSCVSQTPISLSSVISVTPKVLNTSTNINTVTTSSRTSSVVSVTPTRHTTRQHSISSVYDSAIGSQAQIVERAKQEAYVMQRIAELRKSGLWSSRRLPKVQEPPRIKTHWDYLLEEMTWLATDFAQERKWKKNSAKKCAKMVMKYHQDKQCGAERAQREQLSKLKKIASNIAKQVKQFWTDIEKVVEAKQELKLNEKRKKLHDMHLNFIVDKADKYTEKLTQKLGNTLSDDNVIANETREDSEFEPENSESDDEETISKAEEEEGNINDRQTEIDLLRREGEMPIEDLKASLRSSSRSSKSSEDVNKIDDNDFNVDEQSIDAEDDEETIQEQEKTEGNVDYSQEINELENDANIPIEELLQRYTQECGSPLDSDDDEQSVDNDDDNDDYKSDDNDDEEDDEEYDEDMSEEEETGEIGMEFLINPDAHDIDRPLIEEICDEETNASKDETLKSSVGPNKEITDIAAGAQSLQPKGFSLSTVKVCTTVPFLLKHELREYQHIGLDWLVAMHDKRLNGILADEMGLGKTIQTIALLAHLACERGIWGPHLIVVPTSVMLNWEMEFKKWCPAFKILTYYGSPKERKQKRTGWTKPNQFHVCITSYKLVIQDHQSFRRKKWKYFILDEAQHIKNFKSQRWQMLLNFNTSRRLLLTGTPLQNNLMELWSLMHFLMPNVFQSHKEFKDWFVNPVTGMIEGNSEYNEGLIRRLHKVLRPFLLRRLKCDVEKQLPKKYEHVVMCRLSKRQRFLYEEYMSLGKTRETLASGNFLSVINILMQLRKVCNHPNLFEPRPTLSSLMIEPLTYDVPSLITTALDYDPLRHVNLKTLNLVLSDLSFTLSAFAHHRIARFMASPSLIQEIDSAPEPSPRCPRGKIRLQIRTSTAAIHSASQVTKPSQTNTTVITSPGNRNAEQKFLITHNPSVNMQSSANKSPTSVAPSTEANRIAIPLGRLVQTTAGQHILLRTASGTPISSTLSPSTPILRQNQTQHNPMRHITLVTRMNTPLGIASSQELTPSSKLISSPYHKSSLMAKQQSERKEKLSFLSRINTQRCTATALYASDLIEVSTINGSPKFLVNSRMENTSIFNVGNGRLNCLLAPYSNRCTNDYFGFSNALSNAIKTPDKVREELNDVLSRFVCIVPRVVAPQIQMNAAYFQSSKKANFEYYRSELNSRLSNSCDVMRTVYTNMRLQFPELRLIQYDCGKLQTLDRLLWELKTSGHRVLIFTQMSRMLDIFEQFLNHHGHTYLRLDGSTKIEQRQALMERFNADKRIFCFILSTRSGGIGVNLTGADTVIFYDSDWNPTMDAQAQDRCHRIGQTRDVHIYRLISEMTVEENILKKAQQKRLLGDVAIEGGNFTTAFFKKHAIRELFGIDIQNDSQISANESMSVELAEGIADSQLEQALCTVEEDNDIAAVKTARAEAAAEFAEFDENIPLDVESKEEEISPEEERINEIIEQLRPIERYALCLLETFQESSSFEQLKQAEEEIEAHKKEWELGRLEAERIEMEKSEANLDEEREPLLTCHRDDAYNQVYISYNGSEQMPIWAPPTPPQDENDLYIDYSMGFLYEQTVMPESQLPPIYVPKESNKRLRLDTTTARKQKARKEEGFNMPRSLFDRPSTAIIKLRRELILQKLRGCVSNGPESAAIHRTLNALGANCPIPQSSSFPSHVLKSSQLLGNLNADTLPSWSVHEEWAVLQVMQHFQDLPLTLLVLSPAHIPNWDLVSDVVNSITNIYRSPKFCKYHYETTIVPREEGKLMYESLPKQKQKKAKAPTTAQPTPSSVSPIGTTSNAKPNVSTRPVKTSQLFTQDNNTAFSQLNNQRFETIKQIANKRTPTLKPMFINPTGKNPKHIALLTDNGINYDQPLTPIQVALNRAERISREKQKAATDQQLATQAARQQMQSNRQQSPQITRTILTPNSNLPAAAQHQFQQVIRANALNQSNLSKLSTTPAVVSSLSQTPQIANLTKTLAISSPQQHSIPQPILSQIVGSSPQESASPGIQIAPQTCSVVSVATLNPQGQQKLIAAVAPVGQLSNAAIANRLSQPQSQQVYKQFLLRTQQPIQRQTSPHIQIQQVSQQSPKLQAAIGIGQQQQRFQITATVAQPLQSTQSLIASASGVKTAQTTNIVPIVSTTVTKPQQINITRTISDATQMAQLLKRQQLTSQSSANLQQTQILLQQSSPQSQSSQSSQLLQNPVTFVKTLSTPNSLATQSLAIPHCIFTTPSTKAMSPTMCVSSASSATTTIASLPNQLRQIQLLQKKVPQQQQVLQQQQITQSQVTQQLGAPQSQQKVTAIATQAKGLTQLQAPVGTIQIVSQTASQSPQTNKTSIPPTVTMQQLLKQGIVVPHTFQVTQSGTSSPSSGAALLSQSLLQVSQAKSAQLESSQMTPSSQANTLKHIQVVSTSAQSQTGTSVSPKSIIISGQPAILQTASLQHTVNAVQSSPQTLTFAIRTASATQPQTQPPTMCSLTPIIDSVETSSAPKETETNDEQMDANAQQTSSSATTQVRQSPYTTRNSRNNKN